MSKSTRRTYSGIPVSSSTPSISKAPRIMWHDEVIEDKFEDSLFKSFSSCITDQKIKLLGHLTKELEAYDPNYEDEVHVSYAERNRPSISEIAGAYDMLLASLPDWSKARSTFMSFPVWFTKNGYHLEYPDESRLRHSFSCLLLSCYLSSKFKILDVDSMFLTQFPKPSDITLMNESGDLIYLDITVSEPTDAKLSNLHSSASRVWVSGANRVICSVIRFETSITYPKVLPPTSIKGVDWGFSPEAIVSKLQPIFREMDQEQSRRLYETLDAIISPCLSGILPSSKVNSNLVDSIFEEAQIIAKNFFRNLKLNEKEGLELISDLITGRVMGVSRAWLDALKSLPEPVLSSKFTTCGFRGVKSLKRLRKFPFPAPITSLNNVFMNITNLYEYDSLLWVTVEARKLNDSWAEGKEILYTFLSTGVIIPVRTAFISGIDFDERQNVRTPFKNNVVAHIRLLPYKNSNGKTMTPSYFQMLFNPEFTHDDNLRDYYRRSAMLNGERSKKEWVDVLKVEESSENYMESLCHDLLASPLEIMAQAASVRSTRFKTNLVFRNKSSPSISELSCLYEDKMSSMLLNFSDAMSSQSRAYSVLLSARHPENCVSLIESADYSSVGVWFLSGTYPNFKTTWRKIYNICESKDLNLYDLGMLSPIMDRVATCFKSAKIKIGLEKSFLDLVKNSPRFVKASIGRAEKRVGAETTSLSRELLLISSKCHSIDKMHLEWEMELPYKLMTRLASLCEYRHKLYAKVVEESLTNNDVSDMIEVNWNLLSFFPNRQQFSVISTAWRYLHQGLGSIDFEPSSTLNKLSGLSVKSHIEMSYLQRMVSVYKFAMILRSYESINSIRATNREVFVSAPDLLYASNSPNINVSTYSTANLLNVSKQWRISSEAVCVEAAWEQVDALKEIQLTDIDLWYGMPRRMFNEMMSIDISDFDTLIDSIKDRASMIIEHTNKLLAHDSPKNYASNFWFEVMTHSKLRSEKGTFKSETALSGKDLKGFLTMRGSTVSTELKSPLENTAVRKATALVVLLNRLKTNDPTITDADSILKMSQSDLTENIDQFQLLRSLMTAPYVRAITPICQFSEKDAPGKDREISTLNIEFGMLCLLCEKIAQPYSATIPEDLVTHNAKEWSIYKSVLNLERIRETDDSKDVLFINQDKSKYGPNRKVSSMLLSAAILSEDDFTYSAFELSLNMSSRKMISYPHDLVRQSLRIVSWSEKDADGRKKVMREGYSNMYNIPRLHGKTSEVMVELFRQYEGFGRYGPPGSTWVQVREGMPGQGIFTTLSSISHASAQRYFSEIAERELGWSWDSRVTSDDSMTMILHPKSQNMLIHNGIQRMISSLTYQMGLIENKAKMTITARRPEMNTFYMLRGEPVCAVWKFMNAYCSITSSGNIGEDLLACISKGSDLLRFGGSVFTSSFLSAALVTMTLDAYRFWGPYLSLPKNKTDEIVISPLWNFPTELFGLPNLDPVSSIISPIGTRMNTALNKWLKREDADNYSRIILEMNLSSSKVDQDNSYVDQYGNKIRDGIVTYVTKDGSTSSVIGTLPPTVNGLIGMLYRRKKDIKVAKELSMFFTTFSKIEAYKGWTVKSLLQNIPFFFDVPVKMGHSERSILENYTEIAHNPEYKFLKVSPNSFLPKALKGTKISMNDLKELLMKPETLNEMQDSFKARLAIKSQFPPALETMARELFDQAKSVLDVSDMLSSSKLKANDVKKRFCEHASEDALGKLAFKRLLKVSTALVRKEGVYLNGIRNEILANYINCIPSVFNDVKASPIEPRGDMDEYDAYYQTRVALERVKTLIPKPSIVYSETQGGVRSPEADLLDWLRYNAFSDHHFSIPEDSIKASGVLNSSALTVTSGVVDDMNVNCILSYVNGFNSHEPSYSYEIQPVTKRYVPCESGIRLPIPFPHEISSDEMEVLYLSGQVVSPSFSMGLLLDSTLITGLWYGGPLERVKVDSKFLVESEEGYCWGVTTTRYDSFQKLYIHTTITFMPASIAIVRPGSKLESKVLGSMPLIGVTIQDLLKGVTVGEDVYNLKILNSSMKLLVSLNFTDYFFKDLDSDFYMPTGKFHVFSSFGHKFAEACETLSKGRKRINAGPRYRAITKIPVTSLSLADSSEWARTLSELMTTDTTSEATLTMIDLASSFFVSGKSTNDLGRIPRTPPELVNTRELGRKMMRLRNFRTLSKAMDGRIFPIVSEFYDSFEVNIMSRLNTETLNMNRELSLTLTRGVDEDIVRLSTLDVEPGEETIASMISVSNPLVEAFKRLIEGIPDDVIDVNDDEEDVVEEPLELPAEIIVPNDVEDVTSDMIEDMEDVEIEFEFE
jgi:hypothetical protein